MGIHLAKQDEISIDDLDGFDEEMHDHNEEMQMMLDNIFEESNHQMNAALELTKLLLDTNEKTGVAVNEEKVFDLYRQAIKVVCETSPMNKIMDRMKELTHQDEC